MPCLDDCAASAYLDGGVDSAAAANIDDHLDQCPPCRQLIAALSRVASAPAVAAKGSIATRSRGTIELPTTATIGRYRLGARLGGGAMGVVYRAYDPTLEREVALKLCRRELAAAHASHLRVEGAHLARLTHPNVVRVYDAGVDEGYIAMELVDGGDLASWLAARPRSWQTIVDVFAQVVRGLAAAHELELVHCDVKPQNILIGRDGVARIGDFGLAFSRARGGPTTAGTPHYVAPEQLRGAPEPRSDQYSLCVALDDALATASDRDAIPAQLRRVIARGRQVDPDARFASITLLGDALAVARGRVRRPAVVLARAVAVVAVGVVAAFAAHAANEGEASDGDQRSPPDPRRADALVTAALTGSGSRDARADALFDTVREAEHDGDRGVAVRGWTMLGVLAGVEGAGAREGERWFAQASAVAAHAEPDARRDLEIESMRVVAAIVQHRLADARAIAIAARVRVEASPNAQPAVVAAALDLEGVALAADGDRVGATPRYERAIALAERHAPEDLAMYLTNYAEIATPELARALLERAISSATAVGRPDDIDRALAALAAREARPR